MTIWRKQASLWRRDNLDGVRRHPEHSSDYTMTAAMPFYIRQGSKRRRREVTW